MKLGLEPHVLRYWETEFDALQPDKDASGQRVYTHADLKVAQRIQYLLKEEKYTIEGARRALQRESSRQHVVRNLHNLRGLLQELSDQL